MGIIPFFRKNSTRKNLPSDQEEMAKIYNKDGYIVLKNLFAEEEIDKAVSEMHEKGFNPDYHLIKTRDANRCQDLWEHSESVKNLSTIVTTTTMITSYLWRR